MSEKTTKRTKEQPKPAVTTTSIRASDLPKLDRLASSLGMKKVEYLGRVIDRDARKPREALAGELLGAK